MVDRKNANDIFNVVKDDFNWIIEDIEQHSELLKEKMCEAIKVEDFDEMDDLKESCKAMKKIITKIEALKIEYTSLFEEESSEEGSEGYKKDLADWTGVNPNKIKLFGVEQKVKYWREVLSLIIEELINKNPAYIKKLDKLDDFKGRTREYFTYSLDKDDKKFYKVASNGLYYLVNSSANATMSLCRKVLRIGGYEEEILQILEYRGDNLTNDKENKINKIDENNIKLAPQYASIAIQKDVFKEIVRSMSNNGKEYGKDYINPRDIEKRFERQIIDNTNYTSAYPVVINIIKYLKDLKMIAHLPGTKKGKYIVVNEDTLSKWVECNI